MSARRFPLCSKPASSSAAELRRVVSLLEVFPSNTSSTRLGSGRASTAVIWKFNKASPATAMVIRQRNRDLLAQALSKTEGNSYSAIVVSIAVFFTGQRQRVALTQKAVRYSEQDMNGFVPGRGDFAADIHVEAIHDGLG